jgi:hypothetical protein
MEVVPIKFVPLMVILFPTAEAVGEKEVILGNAHVILPML